MKIVMAIIIGISLAACTSNAGNPKKTVKLLDNPGVQDSIFNDLISLTKNALTADVQNDSLAFLVLPLEASCPSCREKTIDSLIKYKDRLSKNHFIIITAGAGLKTMRSYFLERDGDLPVMPGRVFLDSTNDAYRSDLYSDNPAFYYTSNGKAYKKILALPATIREDLREFFSGTGNRETAATRHNN